MRRCDHCGNVETDDDILIQQPTSLACYDCHNDCMHLNVEDGLCLDCGEEFEEDTVDLSDLLGEDIGGL